MIHIRLQATWYLIWIFAVDIACDVLKVSAKCMYALYIITLHIIRKYE